MRRFTLLLIALAAVLAAGNVHSEEVPKVCIPEPVHPDTPGVCVLPHKVSVQADAFPLRPSDIIIDATDIPGLWGTARYTDYDGGGIFGWTLIDINLNCVSVVSRYELDGRTPHTVYARGTNGSTVYYLIATTEHTGRFTQMQFRVTKTAGSGPCRAPTTTNQSSGGDFIVIP